MRCALNYRVLNLAANTFNDARTSYRLKSIGGYSAAKLRRSQDLIDMHIKPEKNPLMQTIMQTQGFMLPDAQEGKNFPVLNMLNMKYAVVSLQNGQQVPVQNPYAMGYRCALPCSTSGVRSTMTRPTREEG